MNIEIKMGNSDRKFGRNSGGRNSGQTTIFREKFGTDHEFARALDAHM
jgi:hypothetical protein